MILFKQNTRSSGCGYFAKKNRMKLTFLFYPMNVTNRLISGNPFVKGKSLPDINPVRENV